MARRSTPQRKVDDAAFPIRIRLIVPDRGFGRRIDDIHSWLRELPPGQYAWHSAESTASYWANYRQAAAVYFRSIDTARDFIAAFPDLDLDDTVG